jgi:hypothetical protein
MLSASDAGSGSQDKTPRVGTHGSGTVSSEAQAKTKSLISVGRNIIRYEGIRGLFKGGLIRAGWTAIALGLYLSLYEGGRFYLENRRKERDLVNGKLGRPTGEGVEGL